MPTLWLQRALSFALIDMVTFYRNVQYVDPNLFLFFLISFQRDWLKRKYDDKRSDEFKV